MARTTKRRRKKHRGTQGGTLDRRGRASRPRSRQEARARARKQLGSKKQRRGEGPPIWRTAFNRGLFAAGFFLLLLVLLFHQPIASSIFIAIVMLGFYIPMGYAIERFFYNRRQAAERRKRADRAGGGG
jgi:Flp pilus assembly protein TadB